MTESDVRYAEVRRMSYLRSMGVDSYLSRLPLAGAMPTRRLGLDARDVRLQAQPQPEEDGAGVSAIELMRSANTAQAPAPAPATQLSAGPHGAGDRPTDADAVEHFSLITLQMAGWLWLEELPPGAPEEAYWQLANAIGVALAGPECRLQRARFDWPMHRSAQLDAGSAAASAALQAFLERRLEHQRCAGLVLLGEAAQQRVAQCQLPLERRLNTVSIAAMLRDAGLKRVAWRDLHVLRAGH